MKKCIQFNDFYIITLGRKNFIKTKIDIGVINGLFFLMKIIFYFLDVVVIMLL